MTVLNNAPLEYRAAPQLVAMRAKLAELQGRREREVHLRSVARRQLAEAENAVLAADVAVASGDGTEATLKAARASLANARLVYEGQALSDESALAVATADLHARYEERESAAAYEAIQAFKATYGPVVREMDEALAQVAAANERLGQLWAAAWQTFGWSVDSFPMPWSIFIRAAGALQSPYQAWRECARQAGLLD